MHTLRRVLFLTSIVHKCRLHNMDFLCTSVHLIHTNDKKMTTIDIIDDFTEQLVKEKSKKFNDLYNGKKLQKEMEDVPYLNPWKFDFKSKLKHVKNHNKLEIDVSSLSLQQIDSLIISALDAEDFYNVDYLIGECLKYQRCPTVETLTEVFSYYSFGGNVKMVISLSRFCNTMIPQISISNSQFEHYLAKAYWIKGHVEKGLIMFLDIYENNSDLRMTIRKMIKYLANDTVVNRSEASLVILKKHLIIFGEKLNDWNPLSYFWECCWLSEWFGDQQEAERLFKEYNSLQILLCDKLIPMAVNALKSHNEDAVLRLLQLTLSSDMKHHYTRIVEALFLYRYKRQDFHGCHQIVVSCGELKIPLPAIYLEKYLNLLIVNGFESMPCVKPVQKKNVKSFDYKF